MLPSVTLSGRKLRVSTGAICSPFHCASVGLKLPGSEGGVGGAVWLTPGWIKLAPTTTITRTAAAAAASAAARPRRLEGEPTHIPFSCDIRPPTQQQARPARSL